MSSIVTSRAVVTGGASNIGRAVVLALAEAGARVSLIDLDMDQAHETAGLATDGRVEAIIADLRDPDAAASAIDAAGTAIGGIDILVNNAGLNRIGRFSSSTVNDWRQMIELNLIGTLAVTHAALPYLTDGGGSLITISSDAALGESGQAVYGATKAGLIAFTRSLAREHGPDGLRCNVVAPGVVQPDTTSSIGTGSMWSETTMFTDEVLQQLTRRTALGRLPSARDVASAVLFLADDSLSSAITGQVLSVNSGFAMRG